MTQLLYIGFLLVAIIGLTILDWRYKLAYWRNVRHTALTILCGVGIFVIWDLIGIGTGIFLKGWSPYMLPFEIVPEFPIEELFFLYLLCYVTLTIYRGVERWRPTL